MENLEEMQRSPSRNFSKPEEDEAWNSKRFGKRRGRPEGKTDRKAAKSDMMTKRSSCSIAGSDRRTSSTDCRPNEEYFSI